MLSFIINASNNYKENSLAFGSDKKDKIKTKRISSLPIMNKEKKKALVDHFSKVKRHKNNQSNYIFNHKHLLLTQENKKILLTHYKNIAPDFLYSWENQKLFQMSVDFYSNWLDKIMDNNKFAIQKEYKVTYYKKNVYSKKNVLLSKKGDVKSKEVIMKKTPLTRLLNWLIYVEEHKLDDVLKSIPKNAKPKTVDQINNFNKELNALRKKEYWSRIKSLLTRKTKRLLNKINKPIEFTTGSYMKIPVIGQTQHSYISKDETNKQYHYWYNFRIGKDSIRVPLGFNKKYHKTLQEYNLIAAHTVKLNSKNGIDIGLTYNDTNEYFTPLIEHDAIDKTKVVGIDLNVASNFCTIAYHDHVNRYDYDRDYIQRIIDIILKFNKKGYNDLKPNQQKRLDKLLGGVEFYFKHLISDIISNFIDNGITDIVLEDLDLTQCKASFIKDEALGIKYSRIIRLLRLSSIKTWFKQQANNRGLRVHLTTPSYTSKTCSQCGCIEHVTRNKRLFVCHHCGYEADADDNASINIYNRFCVDVLRNTFHTLKDGQYVPLKMKRENVQIGLSKLFEADNECQRHLKSFQKL